MSKITKVCDVFKTNEKRVKIRGTIGPSSIEEQHMLTDQSGSCKIAFQATKHANTKHLRIGNEITILNPEIIPTKKLIIIGKNTMVFFNGKNNQNNLVTTLNNSMPISSIQNMDAKKVFSIMLIILEIINLIIMFNSEVLSYR